MNVIKYKQDKGAVQSRLIGPFLKTEQLVWLGSFARVYETSRQDMESKTLITDYENNN